MNYYALGGFAFLAWTVLSGVAGAWIARTFANKDLGDETPPPAAGKAWERCTTRDDTGMLAVNIAAPSDDTQPTPELPKDEK